jgi:biopolymer transport protein ExbD
MRRRYNPYNTISSPDGELINLTPLLDVLFVVLIMFILIAPLLDLDRIQLAESSENKAEFVTLKSNHPIKLYVHSDSSIYLGKHALSLEKLDSTMHEFYRMYPEEIPELYIDKETHFGTYQKIKNILEETGFKELDIILKTE